jgi:RNA polymerase-binding transcription factor DksA
MRKTQELLEADAVTEFRERLRNARGELLRTVLLTGDQMRGVGDREPGTLSEDSARGVMTDLVGSLNGRERRELDEIQEAMARLETGSFGTCEICGASISLPRLRAIPWARHCLACQFQQERRA